MSQDNQHQQEQDIDAAAQEATSLEEGVELDAAVEEVILEDSPEQNLIGELQTEVLALKDQLLRAHAEMENIRRRSQDEVAKARKFGTESFAESLIPVRDSLEAGLAQENQAAEDFRAGMETTLRQLTAAFDRNHLKEVNPAVGDKFDPNVHQAISSVPNPEVAANCVMQTLQKGYTMAERVLRPALVIVSAG
ncbi:MAG: nucleotide exchange factor GrpE [Pelistega sp.]|nr:nucleotide exchange factor GrpE [Pelistega sp.]